MGKFIKLSNDYRKIIYAEALKQTLKVSFANGDVVSLPIKKIVIKGFKRLQWDDISMDLEGSRLTIPAQPMDYEISWFRIRKLTDPKFEKALKGLCLRQQKYVGKRIMALRKKSGFSLKRLSEKSKIPVSALRDIENGTKAKSYSLWGKILDALGCSFSDLAYSTASEHCSKK